jgi:hypothetical protein
MLAGDKKASKPKEKTRKAKKEKLLKSDSQKKDTDSLGKGLNCCTYSNFIFWKK